MQSKAKEKEYFLENLVMLTESGMDIVQSLDVILGELKVKEMREIIQKMRMSIVSGEPIYKALETSKLFKAHVVSLIKLGEQSGNFFKNLNVISVQQRKEKSFQSKLRSAMIYPVFVLSIALVVGIGVSWFILPNLTNVFNQLHLELPLSTKILVAFGNFLANYGHIAVPIFLVVFSIFIYLAFFNPKTKFTGQYLLMKFPGVGTLIEEIELSRLGYVLGSLLEAGVPIVDSLRSLRDTATFYNYRRLYAFMLDRVEQGNNFSYCFAHFKNSKNLIPVPIQQMIVTGEQSGHLPDIFKRIGTLFEDKTEDTSKNISVLLEPFLLFVVWLGVLGVALAVILPIYSLIGGLNKP